MVHSGRRISVRRLTCFRHFLSLPLSPTMIQPLPRLHRTSIMILDYCRQTVRLLWTSTLRRTGTGCWEIRRTYLSSHCHYCLFRVLDSLPGCQYRMTSYDVADRPDLNPAYGLHLHDPRFLEYVGAPESARLLSRAPDYWLHHMSRDQTISAALQLQRDVGLIMSNLQVLGQFVTSLNRMSSEVRRLAFGPVGGSPVRGTISSCPAGSPLHGSWASADLA